MKKIVVVLLVTILCFAMLVPNVYAEPASQTATAEVKPKDITGECRFIVSSNQKYFKRAIDKSLKTYWKIGIVDDTQSIRIEIPDGVEDLQGVYLQWYQNLPKWKCYAVTDQGKEFIKGSSDEFYSEFILIPQEFQNVSTLEIVFDPGQPQFSLAEICLFSGGIPDYVPQWEKYDGRPVYALVVACHPDDEALYLGAFLAYLREAGLETVVVVMATTEPRRRLEVQESIWTLGSRIYPILRMDNPKSSSSTNGRIRGWTHDQSVKFLVEQIRRFRPQIVVTHDTRGEYGHDNHKKTFNAVEQAIAKAGDPDQYTESAQTYGVWTPNEFYAHLFKSGNKIKFDIEKPLKAFGGLTAHQLVENAFERHHSQHTGKKDRFLRD